MNSTYSVGGSPLHYSRLLSPPPPPPPARLSSSGFLLLRRPFDPLPPHVASSSWVGERRRRQRLLSAVESPSRLVSVAVSEAEDEESPAKAGGQGEAEAEAGGPIELPSAEMEQQMSSPFDIPATTPLQTAGSLAFTGVLTVLLFRSLRRRSKRAKEMKFRSSGAESITEQAKKATLEKLQKAPDVEVPPPSAVQTFLGGLVAGGIALVLYQFSTAVDASFAGKAVSANYSIRQLTITVRTIVSGICYLATFVFGANSIGLLLYSLQLALNLDSGPPSGGNSGEKEAPTSNSIEDSTD